MFFTLFLRVLQGMMVLTLCLLKTVSIRCQRQITNDANIHMQCCWSTEKTQLWIIFSWVIKILMLIFCEPGACVVHSVFYSCLWIRTEDGLNLDEEATNDCSSEHSSLTKTESDPPGDLSLQGEHVTQTPTWPLCMVSLLLTKVPLSWMCFHFLNNTAHSLSLASFCTGAVNISDSDKHSVSGSEKLSFSNLCAIYSSTSFPWLPIFSNGLALGSSRSWFLLYWFGRVTGM